MLTSGERQIGCWVICVKSSTTGRRPVTYLLAACLAALMMYSGLLARLVIVDVPDRIAVPLSSSRTDPSDNYVYFSLLKRGLMSCREPSDVQDGRVQGNPLACSYIGGLAVANLIWRVARWLTSSSRSAVALLLILNTALLALSFLYALGEILGRTFSLGSAIVLAFGLLFALDNFGLSFSAKEWNLDFQSVLSLEPGFSRLINPSTFWTLGFATIALMIRQVQQPSFARLALAVAAAVICGLAGLAVSATLIGGLGLYLLVHLATTRRIAWSLAVVCAALIAGIAYSFLQVRVFYATPMGKDLQHGQFVGLHLNLAMLFLLIIVVLGKVRSNDRRVNGLAKCLLLASILIGMVCESFELGNRLWLRGSAGIAFLVFLAWLLECNERLAAGWLYRRPNMPWGELRSALSIAIIVAVLLPIAIYVRPPQLDRARGFIDRDKYDVLSWLAPRVGSHTQVASTNIEDSFLVEYYTPSAPFVPLYSLSILQTDQVLRRYFSITDLIEEGAEIFDRLHTVTKSALAQFNEASKAGPATAADYSVYQSLAFYHMLLYYPFTRSTKAIFQPEAPSGEFLNWLRRLRDDAGNEMGRFDYLIIRANEHLREPARFDVVYRNQGYIVLQDRDPGARKR